MEPKSVDFREKIATNRQHYEKTLVFEASETSIKKREKKAKKGTPEAIEPDLAGERKAHFGI